MIEFRWLNQYGHKILQYRAQTVEEAAHTNSVLSNVEYGDTRPVCAVAKFSADWIDVPEVKEP